MSYDLAFRSTTAPRPTVDDVARYFASRRHYTVANGEAVYQNDDTGVAFVFRLGDAGPERAPVTFEVNYFRPSGFGLEAAIEEAALVEAFRLDVSDPQSHGTGEGPYSRDGLLRGWRHGNRFAHTALLGKDAPDSVVALPIWTLEHTWQWNMARASYQDRLGSIEMHPCFVPKVMAVDRPTAGRRVSTAVVWTDFMPIALPEVDVVVLLRKGPDGGPDIRHVAWEHVAPLLGAYEKRVPSSVAVLDGERHDAGLRHWLLACDRVPEELTLALLAKAEAGGPRPVRWESVLCAELVAEAFVMPVVRAVAEGAAPTEDLRFTRFATSAHRTFTTTVKGDGDVEKGEVVRVEKELAGKATREEIRAIAAAVVASGFPNFPPQPPPRDPAGGAMIPPARISVAARGHHLSVEMSQASEVPAVFSEIGRHIMDVERRLELASAPTREAKRAVEETERLARVKTANAERRRTLEAAARGEELVQPIAVFKPAYERERRVSLWTKVELKLKEGRREESLNLGESTEEERRHVAELLLAAGAPDFDVPFTDIGKYPRVGLSVYIGQAQREVDILASRLDDYPKIAAVLNAIYAISRRLGPFTPPALDEPAAKPPAAPAPAPRLPLPGPGRLCPTEQRANR